MVPHSTRQGEEPVGRRTRKRGSGKQWGEGKRFRLADEVRYLQNKAAEHDGRVVALGQLVLFSTDTGGAWLLELDGTDQLAARRARDGDPEPIHLEQSDYQLRYRMEKGAITSRAPPSSTPIVTPVGSLQCWAILGRRSRERISSEISNIFWLRKLLASVRIADDRSSTAREIPRGRASAQDDDIRGYELTVQQIPRLGPPLLSRFSLDKLRAGGLRLPPAGWWVIH